MRSKYILMFGLGAALTACTDLDTDIDAYYTEFPDNEIAVGGEFEFCYHYTRNEAWFGRNFWEGMFLCSDEAVGVNFTGTYFESGRYYSGSVHNFSPDLPSSGLLGDMLAGCNYTNKIIVKYGGESGQDPIVAPLRAIRAYYHFWMMDVYGDVPILDHMYTDDEEMPGRQSRAEVAKFIESELVAVIPQLTEKVDASTYGRPTKWMAEALLAKLYLNWGVYTHDILSVDNTTPNEKLDECVAVCDDIINNGPFDLGSSYRAKFFPNNGVSTTDFIYAIDFDKTRNPLNKDYSVAHQMARFWDYRTDGMETPYMYPWEHKTGSAGVYILTPEAVDRFCLEGDERNEMIAVGTQYTFDANYNRTDQVIQIKSGRKVIGELSFQKEFEWNDISTFDIGEESNALNMMKGARLIKYVPCEQDESYDSYIWQSNDIPVFRLADVYLMKAECILRGANATNGATAASLMTAVRKVSGAPAATNPSLQDLLDERTREFICEPWRRNDLIRFGQFENCAKWKVESNPTTMADKNKRLFPIPTDQLSKNTSWKQNPSY